MITIDGSEGEGGGQVLRCAAALSLVTGEPFSITNIRGKRSKPGLMRQHVTAIEAACVIGGAETTGLAVGSTELSFKPGKVSPGDYHFAVGTAGSTSLVLQTVLMPLIFADAPSRLVLEGGTHNMMAPPFEFLDRCFLPIINRMGPTVTAKLVRHGFYPRGGGRVEVEITPAPLRRIECVDRGALISRSAMAYVAGLSGEIAEREIKEAKKRLPDWPEDAFAIRTLPESVGPGNILMIEAAYENVTEISSGFGKLGASSESIAKDAARRVAGFMATDAFAGPYLADQLLLPFALVGGGQFTTVKPSQHSRTAADIITLFTGRATRFEENTKGPWLVNLV
jgi:RNA 3'-terminal phosphate cyclase (ATP)